MKPGSRPGTPTVEEKKLVTQVTEEKKVEEKKAVTQVTEKKKLKVAVLDGENVYFGGRESKLSMAQRANLVPKLLSHFNRVVVVHKRSLGSLQKHLRCLGHERVETVRVYLDTDEKMTLGQQSTDDMVLLSLAVALKNVGHDVTVVSDDTFETLRCGNSDVVRGAECGVSYCARGVSVVESVWVVDYFRPSSQFSLEVHQVGSDLRKPLKY